MQESTSAQPVIRQALTTATSESLSTVSTQPCLSNPCHEIQEKAEENGGNLKVHIKHIGNLEGKRDKLSCTLKQAYT